MGHFKIAEVIFADDDEISRIVGSKMLRNIGFKNAISHFENGSETLHFVEKKASQKNTSPANPVLVFLDINMPVMDGWDFLDKFSKLPPAVRQLFFIIMLTSSIDDGDRDKANSYAAIRGYFHKPLSRTKLLALLQSNGLYTASDQ